MSTIYSSPELGPPMPKTSRRNVAVEDLTGRVASASATVHMLVDKGMLLAPLTTADERTVAAVLTAYAQDPEATSRISTNTRIGTMTPASLRALDRSLKEFGQNVVESSTQLRHYVTNKLIEESDNPDPRIRVRALELLGKISDVGLFADKTEVTITHQTTSDLKEALRAKLERLVNPDAEDAEIVEATALPGPQPTPVPDSPDDDTASEPEPHKPTARIVAAIKPRQASTEKVPKINLDDALAGWDD